MLFQEFSKSFVSGLGTYTSLVLVFHLYYTLTKTENVQEESPEESKDYAQLFDM